MVVSSVTPWISAAILVHRSALSASESVRTWKMTCCSWLAGRGRVGREAVLLGVEAEVDEQGRVAAVVEDHVGEALDPSGPSGHIRICWVHHQYSSSDSPFQAKTGTPAGASTVPSGPTATAAAAWSWVEKMLQDAQRTSAPRCDQRLDEDGGLDRHVQRAGDAGTGQRLGVAVALAHGHQAGHLVLGELDLGATEVGQGEVGDLEVHGASSRVWVGWKPDQVRPAYARHEESSTTAPDATDESPLIRLSSGAHQTQPDTRVHEVRG